MRRPNPKARLAAYLERCRSAGLSVTPQRLAVLEALVASLDHPDAEALWLSLRPAHPRLSRATVHRTLEALVSAGEARKVTPLHAVARYDGNVAPHHHLVCLRCHRVQDVHDPRFDGLARPGERRGDFQIESAAVELRGLCKDCRHAPLSAESPR